MNNSLHIRDRLRSRADQLIAAFSPRDIPLVPRSARLCEEKVRQSIVGPRTRTIAVTAPGGFGKTVLLGELYGQLRDSVGWIGLLRGADVVVPSDPWQLSQELARVLGYPGDLIELAELMVHSSGRGIVLFDTLDRILDAKVVPVLHELFGELVSRGVTVVFSCRDYEYADLLDPISQSMPRLSESLHRERLPPFDPPQVRAAVEAYFRRAQSISPDGARAFVDTVLALRSDDVQISELARVPLLLAVLCKLYGPQGYIPHDLTISSLWDDYWRHCVRGSGGTPVRHPEAQAREYLCYELASQLLRRSRTHLQPYLREEQLNLPPAALAQLLSQGVLVEEERRLGFFHQTLLEYVIARWLMLPQGGEDEDRILSQTRSQGAQQGAATQTFLWPIIRQYVAICDADRYAEIVGGLDWSNFSAVRALLFGAVARNEGALLQQLAAKLLSLTVHQRVFLEAVSTVHIKLVPDARDAILLFLEQGDQRNAEIAVEALATLTNRAAQLGGDIVRKLITTVSAKRFAASNRDLSFLMSRFLDRLSELTDQVDPGVLEVLRANYLALTPGVQAKIVKLHAQNATLEAKRELVELARTGSITEIVHPFMVAMAQSMPGQWDGLCVLGGDLKSGWHHTWASVVGHWAGSDAALARRLVEEFDRSPAGVRPRYTMALVQAIDSGGAESVLQPFLTQSAADLARDPRLVGDFSQLMEAWSRNLDTRSVGRLRQYAEPICSNSNHRTLSGQLCLWQGSDDELTQIADRLRILPDAQFRQTLSRVLYNAPMQTLQRLAPRLEDLLNERPKRLGDVLALLYAKVPTAFADPIGKLAALAGGDAKKVGLAAAKALRDLAVSGYAMEPNQILPLGRAKLAGIQQHWAHTLLAIVERKAIDMDALVTAGSLAARPDADFQARIAILALIRACTRLSNVAPTALVVSLAEMVEQDVERRRIMIGHITALKAVAEFAPQGQVAQLEKLLAVLLVAVDMASIHPAEHEMSDAIKAAGRRDEALLQRLCDQLDLARLAPRNVRALAIAARTLQGPASPILQMIEHHPACPTEAKNLIAQMRTGQ